MFHLSGPREEISFLHRFSIVQPGNLNSPWKRYRIDLEISGASTFLWYPKGDSIVLSRHLQGRVDDGSVEDGKGSGKRSVPGNREAHEERG